MGGRHAWASCDSPDVPAAHRPIYILKNRCVFWGKSVN